jgi:hypothetical protein
MHKYAAATALGIALITMVALTVSASLTPANATAVCPRSSDTVTTGAHMWGVLIKRARQALSLLLADAMERGLVNRNVAAGLNGAQRLGVESARQGADRG